MLVLVFMLCDDLDVPCENVLRILGLGVIDRQALLLSLCLRDKVEIDIN